ncbi:hypothetical protein [Palleniella muris]|uniref:hypothetical protein n=1 Tax=Palleniella muris TaxID=3038145 RepID=UPI001442804A|nr:hypothetical protein [Palleniella muris]
MEIAVHDKETIKDLINGLIGKPNVVVNIYYQEIGSILNSTLENVNTYTSVRKLI